MSRRLLASLLLLTSVVAAQGFPDVFYYRMDEGNGLDIINWANPSVAPAFNLGLGGVWDTTTPQVGSSALNFAGTDHLLAGAGIDASQSYTIEMWVRSNYTGTSIGRLWADYSIGLFRCYLGFYNTGANYLGANISPAMNVSTANVLDMNWHHIALVFDATAGTHTSYVDGVIDMQQPGAPGNVGTNFELGGKTGVSPIFNGAVDEVRVWQSARTQADIVAAMNTTLTSPVLICAFGTTTATSGPAPHQVSFVDFSETPAAGGITSWAWDFDGDTLIDSTAQNPCFAYTAPGTYDVTLTVTDASGSASTTRTGLVTVGNADFVMTTCGDGSLFLGAPTPPMFWNDGFTLVSATRIGPAGLGWFFGLYPDLLTWQGILAPALPGNPIHFQNIGNPALFPDSPISLPAGTFAVGSGFGFDAVIVYRDVVGNIIGNTGVARITF